MKRPPTTVTGAAPVFLRVAVGVVLLVEAVLALLILRGLNWPRVLVMCFSVVSISSFFTAWWIDDLEITLTTSLLPTALDTLILLALSSRSAAANARRNERR